MKKREKAGGGRGAMRREGKGGEWGGGEDRWASPPRACLLNIN